MLEGIVAAEPYDIAFAWSLTAGDLVTGTLADAATRTAMMPSWIMKRARL